MRAWLFRLRTAPTASRRERSRSPARRATSPTTTKCAAPTSGSDVELFTDDAEQTMALGRRLGAQAEPGWVIGLSGDLGAGKTTFTRGFLEGLGGDPGDVTSPTFTLMHQYRARVPVYHLDLYRL